MLPAAAAQVLALLAVALLAPRLARAAWPLRAPVPALLLWQALGLTTGLLALEAAATVALAPLGPTPRAAVRALPGTTLGALPWWSLVAAVVLVGVLARLLQVLGRSLLRTVRDRSRHRALVDLVATRNPLLRGASVVDSALPVAYCLPGWRSRVVVSRGVLAALEEDELRAVVDHELAHVVARHDLVVLPFVALDATFPGVPPVRRARESVALLVEVLADDRAARRHGPRPLARALVKVGGGSVPGAGAPAAAGPAGSGAALVRAGRLLRPPPPLPLLRTAAVLLAVVLVALLPVLGALLPAVL